MAKIIGSLLAILALAGCAPVAAVAPVVAAPVVAGATLIGRATTPGYCIYQDANGHRYQAHCHG